MMRTPLLEASSSTHVCTYIHAFHHSKGKSARKPHWSLNQAAECIVRPRTLRDRLAAGPASYDCAVIVACTSTQ